jgi:hypothetical protein
MVRFVERKTVAPLALAAFLVPVALTGHHAGLVALAPLLVASPTLVRWARGHLPVTATLVAAAAALVVVLAFVGSDADLRRADARASEAFASYAVSWRDEILRYAVLGEALYGTPLRRATAALMALAVLAFVLRRRRARRALLDVPAASLAVGLLLLVAAPSKWPWHFGALVGIAALAVATETARVREDANRSTGWQVRPFLAIGAATLAVAWCWSPRQPWGLLDLRTLDWTLGVERRLPLSTLAVASPVLLLVALSLVAVVRRRRRLWEIPWGTVCWTAVLIAVPLVAFTAAVLIVDTAKTTTWTLARQNIEAASGNTGCGLADDALLADKSSMRSLASSGARNGGSLPVWVPPAPVQQQPRFAIGPGTERPEWTPWFRLPSGRGFGVFVAGTLTPTDRLALDWGRLDRGRIDPFATSDIAVKYSPSQFGIASWRFFASEELPRRPAGANVVRVSVRSAMTPGAAVAVTAPVTYRNEQLAKRLEGDGSLTLVNPGLLSYLPCARQPELSGGAVDVPSRLVRATNDDIWSVGDRATNPFLGLLDLYRVEQLPLTDSGRPLENIAVFEIDREIRGARLAPPSKVTPTS